MEAHYELKRNAPCVTLYTDAGVYILSLYGSFFLRLQWCLCFCCGRPECWRASGFIMGRRKNKPVKQPAEWLGMKREWWIRWQGDSERTHKALELADNRTSNANCYSNMKHEQEQVFERENCIKREIVEDKYSRKQAQAYQGQRSRQ